MGEYVYQDRPACPECNLRDRHSIAQDYFDQMVNRLDSMFKWNIGEDEKTIPVQIMERYLKLNGWCGIAKPPESTQVDNKDGLYCFFGGLGLKPDEYYQPTAIILANPVLGSKTYKIGKDVVWGKNDSMYRGLAQHISRYAHLLAANDISINIAQVNSRVPFILTADTDNGKQSAEKFISDIEEGKLSVVKSSAFNNGVEPKTTSDASAGNYLKALIELHQYLKAQWSLDIGISSNFNMKRERQNTAEVESNAPYLLPLVDDMLKFRKKLCEDVNEMFDRNWSVELDSAWQLENETQSLQVEAMRNIDESTQVDNDDEVEVKEEEDEQVS